METHTLTHSNWWRTIVFRNKPANEIVIRTFLNGLHIRMALRNPLTSTSLIVPQHTVFLSSVRIQFTSHVELSFARFFLLLSCMLEAFISIRVVTAWNHALPKKETLKKHTEYNNNIKQPEQLPRDSHMYCAKQHAPWMEVFGLMYVSLTLLTGIRLSWMQQRTVWEYHGTEHLIALYRRRKPNC